MPPLDEPLRSMWPSTQSMELVEGSLDAVELAIKKVLGSWWGVDGFASARVACRSLKEAFDLPADFSSGGDSFLLLPTRSRWTVVWSNSFLCDGYDSLSYCLTKDHGMRTIHWSAHDDWTTFQSGASFHLRAPGVDGVWERRVQTAQQDRKWFWSEEGEPLPEEDEGAYRQRIVRRRLDEAGLMGLLSRLGAEPWREGFYDFPRDACMVRRKRPPTSLIRRSRAEVLRPPSREKP